MAFRSLDITSGGIDDVSIFASIKSLMVSA